MDSGMPAFFVLSIVIIFLLLKGKTMVVSLASHIVLIVVCYYIGFKFPGAITPLTRMYQVQDNILGIMCSGLFIGVVILFQNRIYELEKNKAGKAGHLLARRDKLLNVINDAAGLLLSLETEEFDSIMGQSMEMMARDLDVDRMHIWQNIERGGVLHYRRIYTWSVKGGLFRGPAESDVESSYRETLPAWGEILAAGNCVNGPLSALESDEQERLVKDGICSLLIVPVFLHIVFWGLISFDDDHRERFFHDDEVRILRSGSLLLANALVRNEVMQSLVYAREAALSGARAKSEFLAIMSHEMRTPMNAIIGMTAIAKSSADVDRKNSCLAKIENASKHLLGVINDVLDMSKIEANKLELSFVSFDFEKMLQQVVNVINFRIDEKHQYFFVSIDPGIPRFLIGDDQRLAQVITNLLSNAVKFTPENGSIKLSSRFIKEENGVCTIQVEVNDTGIGISPEQHSRLFTSFEQADSNTSRKFGGTGLGLAISKRIVELMGGRIWIESEIGKGSTFTFTIEARRDTEERNAPLETGSSRKPGENGPLVREKNKFEGHRILLAEDVEINREIVQALLEPTLLAVDYAENGAEAVKRYRESPDAYDMIFMDIQMPEMDGYEATSRIRELEKSGVGRKSLPIVAMTANVFREDVERCLEAGMNSHVGKPLDFEEVLGKLRAYLP
jgi:signal transduction histidine kinase/CheY-like chemotaxis protein